MRPQVLGAQLICIGDYSLGSGSKFQVEIEIKGLKSEVVVSCLIINIRSGRGGIIEDDGDRRINEV